MATLASRGILGTFFHAPDRGAIEVLEDTLILLDETGAITQVFGPEDPGYRFELDRLDNEVLYLPEGTYGLPGFVDLHVHAPQYPQLGLALDEPLEVWLHKYTFPLEARYADLDFARQTYETLVADLLATGTTTALYFATVHREATQVLADICIEKGQRALVGKVVMDDPAACPDYYRDATTEAALADTRAVIEYIKGHTQNAQGRVLPVVTPRFIASCTDEGLAGLGKIAAETGCHVQTHCSESDWAHGHVLARYGHTDAEALDRFGLVTRRSVLAHSNFLTDADMDRLVARGAAVAHCALSNAYFANSVFPLRQALEKQLHVGLGTDISGGPSASMFEACRMTVAASRMLEDGVDAALPAAKRGRPDSRIDLVTAFHLATAGGGIALDLPIGRFAPGYRFDAVAIDSTAPQGGIRLFGETQPQAIFEKLLYGATRANVAAVWVDGEQVVGSP
ncbi:guanine deaminase [Devosia nitrariae]|uniref:Guanine deaminase n=1 Tax=Devosia nitrariae TaxID=2071872 RepID=A0ABQ5W913_9HYPH|nr:guanine deaminase [Devosia nitrariae]GLQ56347.1 chlorohydrolase [Devosia nitrariae]